MNFKMMTGTLGITSLLVIFASGCASMVNKVDQESLKKIKTVAIVGFTYDQQLANSGSKILDNLMGANDNAGMGKILDKIETKPHITAALDISQKKITEKKGWKFVDRASVLKNAQIQALYQKKNATIQTGVTPLQPHFYRYEVPGLPQFYYLQFADKGVLNSIAKDLGVDALIFVNAKTRLSQTSVMGIGVGSIGSVTDVALFVYDPKASDFSVIMNASGDEIETKGNQFAGFADKDFMNIQALESCQSAVGKAVDSI